MLGLGDLLPGHGFDTVVAAMADVRDAALVIAAPVETLDRIGLLRPADLVVTAPHRDPYGTVALEAMAHGLPVVASSVGALADLVVDKITGRLVPPGDPRALALVLRELVADSTRRDALGLAAADRVRARYGWDRVAGDAVLVYQRAADLSARDARTAVLGGRSE